MIERAYGRAKNLSATWGKEVWVSEWGPLYVAGSDLGVSLFMARQIIESVNYMGATAWCYWQPIDSFFLWSLINVTKWDTQNPGEVVFSKKYFILQHFTWNVSPGSRAIPISSAVDCRHGAAAFYDPATRSVSIFAVNQQNAGRSVHFNLQSFRRVNTKSPVEFIHYRTSLLEDFAQVEPPPNATLAQPFRLPLLARSFSTVVITNVAPSNSPIFNKKPRPR